MARDPLLYTSINGQVRYLDHKGEPGDVVSEDSLRATLIRRRAQARTMAEADQMHGAALASCIADEIAHCLATAALQRADAQHLRQEA
jgi:hypothetical protein